MSNKTFIFLSFTHSVAGFFMIMKDGSRFKPEQSSATWPHIESAVRRDTHRSMTVSVKLTRQLGPKALKKGTAFVSSLSPPGKVATDKWTVRSEWGEKK